LMDYHREYLDQPARYGIRIERFTATDGTPCLFVTPAATPGERGVKIRQQLTERKIAIPPFGEIRGSLVLTHGLKGRKEDYLSIAERLCAVGFRCVIPDMPAHGEHPVETITYGVREASLPAQMLKEAAGKFGFPVQPAGIMGMSMGGSVAVHSAALPDAPWKALVVVASFDSLLEIIQGQAAQHAGVSFGPDLARAAGDWYRERTGIPLSDIQPVQRAATLRIPTLIAHGTDDTVAPLAAGRRLFEALPEATTKQWIEVPDAGHHNVFVTSYPIYSEIAAWLMAHVK
jgi:pimeloyl-ACP methyl ester carboxylesterase